MAKLIDWELTEIKDKDGVPRLLRGCPITQLPELEEKVLLLWALLAQYPDLDILTLYRCHAQIQALTDDCLNLCSISPGWLTPEMMVQLLHHYEDEEGTHKGLLIEQNLPHLAQPLMIQIQAALAELEQITDL